VFDSSSPRLREGAENDRITAVFSTAFFEERDKKSCVRKSLPVTGK
jgi:hypothetical protein